MYIKYQLNQYYFMEYLDITAELITSVYLKLF